MSDRRKSPERTKSPESDVISLRFAKNEGQEVAPRPFPDSPPCFLCTTKTTLVHFFRVKILKVDIVPTPKKKKKFGQGESPDHFNNFFCLLNFPAESIFISRLS